MFDTALALTEAEGLSHNPEILKRVLIRNGRIPALTTFAQAVFQPGQVCSAHVHETMYEVYLCERGFGKIDIDGDDFAVVPGGCIVVEPGERHSLRNTGNEELVVTYFGIAVD